MNAINKGELGRSDKSSQFLITPLVSSQNVRINMVSLQEHKVS